MRAPTKTAPKQPVLTKRQHHEAVLGQLDNDFSSWRPHLQDISNHLLPRNGRFFTSDKNRGEKRHNRIYDNTGTRALRTLGAGLMAGATSPARPWVRVVTGNPKNNRVHGVRVWLDEVTRRILRVFEKSNTYRVLHQMYEELGAFGTAACIVLPDFNNVIHVYPLTAGEYRLAQDHQGKVNTCYRRFDKTVAEIVNEFGWDNCSARTQDLFRNSQLHKTITIIHAIEPRKNRNPDKADALNMPWSSVYYEEGQEKGSSWQGEDTKVLRESGFKRFPVLAPRWAVAGGDVYGHGPGMEALGDVKQLQHEQLRKAQSVDFMTRPPLQAPSAMKNRDLNFMPGGVTFADTASSGGGIRPAFEVHLNLDHLLQDIQDVRERIRGSFFADLFLMLAVAGNQTRMTATEVAERHEEKLIQLGPVLERLHTELLEPLVRLVYEELLEAEVLPPPPEELAGAELSIEFVSMLAQAQRAIGVNSIDRAMGAVEHAATMEPNVLTRVDFDGWIEEVFDRLGVPPSMMRSMPDAVALREAAAKAQAAAAQTEGMAQQAGAMKDMASADTSGQNALTDVMSQFSGYNSPPAEAL